MTPIGLRGQARKSLPDPRVSVRVIAPCQALRSPLRVNSNLTRHTSNRVCIKPGWLQDGTSQVGASAPAAACTSAPATGPASKNLPKRWLRTLLSPRITCVK